MKIKSNKWLLIYIKIISISLILFTAQSGTGSNTTYRKFQVINQVIELGHDISEGMTDELKKEIDNSYNNFISSSVPLDDREYSNFKAHLVNLYDIEKYKSHLKKQFDKHFTIEELEYIRDWWGAELGQKVFRVHDEVDAGSISEEDYSKIIQKLNSSKEGKNKLKKLELMYTRTEMSDQLTDYWVKYQCAISASFFINLAPEKKVILLPTYRKYFEENKDEVRRNIYNFCKKEFFIACSKLSLQELEEYDIYLKSKIGEKFTNFGIETNSRFHDRYLTVIQEEIADLQDVYPDV